MQDLAGKTAVVTGAASGIGLATARAFAEAGMQVVLADIEADALAAAEQRLAEAGHDVLAVPTDVADWDAVRRLADRAVERFGAVHVLHNNAGVVVGGPVAKLSLADWEWVLGVDLWSVIYGVKAFLPHLETAGEGHVVNTASIAGLVSAPNIGPYNVAKFGVVGYTETLQRELSGAGSAIGTSVLCPGAVDTQIVTSARNRSEASAREHETSPEEQLFQRAAGAQLARDGLDPADVAAQVVDAVRTQRFWILPHPEILDFLEARLEGMRSGEFR